MTTRGHAKVLDFGLARTTLKIEEDAAGRSAPTVTELEPLTGPHTTVGTVAYMSPEQLRGGPLDRRTDLFSFGLVLYEMCTGSPAFTGATSAIVIDAILNRKPEPASRVNPEVPATLAAILEKALEKDAALRYQHASELRTDLERVRRGDSSPARQINPSLGVGGWTRRLWPAAAALVLVAAGAVYFGRSSRVPALASRDSILVADFDNRTGDSVFDGTLTQALLVDLDQSPFLNVVSRERVRETLRLMGRSQDERPTATLMREVCQRQAVKAMLSGSIAPLGSHYLVGLEAINCASGDSLAWEQVEVGSREEVIRGLGQAAGQVRARLGESLASVQTYGVPLEQATTSSLDALKAFSAGEEHRASGGSDQDAIRYYQRATELDPDFALAYDRLAATYGGIGATQKAREYTEQAFARSDRVSEREKLAIASRYYMRHGNWDRFLDALELRVKTFPRDWYGFHMLAELSPIMGQYERAVELSREEVRLNPDSVLSRNVLVENLILSGSFDDARKELDDARQRWPDGLEWVRFRLAFIAGDRAEISRHPQDWGELEQRSLAEAFDGKLHNARGLFKAEIEGAERDGLMEKVAARKATLARVEAACGNRQEALRVLATVTYFEQRVTLGDAIAAAALAGDAAVTERLLQQWRKQGYPVYATFGVSGEALLDIQRGDASRAVERLQATARYDLANTPELLPIYVRGLAYLSLKDGTAAAAEFQRVIDHRGVAALSIYYPLSRLQQARALALMGDTARSREAYEAFLAGWKDADPDIPALIEAKRELADLVRQHP